jgi:hypothetical protein
MVYACVGAGTGHRHQPDILAAQQLQQQSPLRAGNHEQDVDFT